MRFHPFLALAIVFAVSGLSLQATAAVTATVSPGDVIKGDTAALYFVGPDNKRYVFPKDNIYFSWFSDFSKVKKVSQAELTSLQLGGNIGAKPGSLIQFVTENSSGRIVVSDPTVYVVDDEVRSNVNQLWRIQNAEQATRLYGSDWEKKIVPVLESLYTNYKMIGNMTDSRIITKPTALSDDFN